MNSELRQLAALALRNAFWHDFSALVNNYVQASADLGVDDHLLMMGEMTSVYGRDTQAKASGLLTPEIKTTGASSLTHATIMDALECDQATEITLNGNKVFERRDGEWYFIEAAAKSRRRSP